MEYIGKYKIIKELGAGGFGAVYLAQDPKLGTQVAIKVFQVKDENLAGLATSSSQDASGILQERFLSEARTLEGLSHNPYVVNLKEFDEMPDGTPYYVMPYLPNSLENEIGKDAFTRGKLEETPKELHPRKLASSRALDILKQILEGMRSVHAAGLIHRDIKPANILFDNQGNVQICDFGIAKLPDTEHSQSGVGMGSRNYMSPEQRESAKHVSPASDVYSIGVLAYRMLTGQLPSFPFEPVTQFSPGVGKPTSDLIEQAIAQQEIKRPADAGAFLKQLNQAITSVDAGAEGEDGEETGTWINEGVPGIKSELKPLETKISQLLTEQGEVTETDQITLQALGDIAGLDEDALSALIKTIEEKLRHQTGPLSNWLKSIARHQGKTRLDSITENALREAGRSIGLTESQITAHIQRKLPDTMISEPSPLGSQAGSSRSYGSPSDNFRSDKVQTDISQTFSAVPETTTQQDADLIKQVQIRLSRLGYKVNENGQLDTRTQMEIKAFERDNELRETGDIDSILTDKLEQALRAQDDEAWQKTQKLNTVEAYAGYQKDNPQGQYVTDADEKSWQRVSEQAKSKFEPETLNEYKQHFPDGKHIGEIAPLTNEINRQKEDKLWNKARNSNKIKSYEVYLAKYPDGRHKEEALKGLEKACYTEQSPAEYLENYPDGQYAAKAKEEIAQQQAKKARVKKNIVLAGAISSILATGYVGYEYSQLDDRAWEVAQKENSVTSYSRFIQEYSDSEYTKKAMQALEWLAEKAWQAAQHENTIEAYQRFIKQYSDSEYAAKAKQMYDQLVDDAAWQQATAQHIVSAYQAYLNNQKQGQYRQKSQERIAQLQEAAHKAKINAEAKRKDDAAWQQATTQNSLSAYQSYLNNQAQGQYRSEAQTRIAAIELENSKVALTINVTPGDATVEILNIKQAYSPGIRLLPNQTYQLRISRTAYTAQTHSIDMGSQSKQLSYALERYIPPALRNLITSMVDIPGGSFQMGSNEGDSDEKPVHRVSIKPFRLMATEVTWAMYQPCIDAGVCTDNRDRGGDEGWGKGNRPVINVSWNNITQEYIPWLKQQTGQTFRLPSEAEWEYAARAGSTTKYSWGNDIVCSQARYGRRSGGECSDSQDGTVAIKSFAPNEFGLYDMHGNVYEWVQDCRNDSYNGAPTNGSAWMRGNCEQAVLRGGSWFYKPVNLRSANRLWFNRSFRSFGFGFRLAQGE